MVSSTLRQSIAARRAKDGDKGFTLIELLVVVLIIGILAAIAIPVFLGQQNSAKDSAVKSDLANAKLAIIGYYTAGGTGSNPAASALTDYGFVSSTGTNPTVFATGNTAFCVSEASGSGTTFKLLAATNTFATGACTTAAG